MDSNQLEVFLQSKMRTNTFALTTILENGTKKISNGLIGYQITQGLWKKLRIYTCFYIKEQLKFEEIVNENFLQRESAKEKVNEILNQYN